MYELQHSPSNTETSNTASPYRLGDSVHFAPIPAKLQGIVSTLAKEFAQSQIESDYSEQVDTRVVPRGFGHMDRVFRPAPNILHAAGFALARPAPRQHWVLTTGVEPHADQFYGPTLLWTMWNDGMEFWQQGGCRRVPPPGDVLIFDDARPHAVDLTPRQQKDAAFDRAVWIGWAVPLRRLHRR